MAGNLTIINATPFSWQKTFQHAQQMAKWDLPDRIDPGELVTVATEWGFTEDRSGDTGVTGYSFSTPSGDDVGFQFQAHHNDGPQLSVLLDNSSTFGNPTGSSIDLGFTNDGENPFIFSGNQKASFESTNPPENWMHQNLDSIGCLPLNRICMPASHNAGMSLFNGKTALVSAESTLAHYTDIAGQLNAGFRFFDIRPVISDGQFFTGHYDEIVGNFDLFSTWQGGNGQSISKIIDQVNEFLDKHNELVIINLSHTLDTDNGYEPFGPDKQKRLFNRLLDLKYRYVAPKDVDDLSTLKLGDLIKDGPAVLIRVDNRQANEHMDVSDFRDKGFYANARFPIFNSFADTDQVRGMSRDQLGKMEEQRQGPDSDMFLLSWTLTTVLNIRMFSLLAHGALFTDLWPAMKKNSYPNFIMLDGIGAENSPINPRNVAAMSVAIMHNFNDDCRG